MDEIEFRDVLQRYELGQLELSGYVRTDFINFIKTLLDNKDSLVSELDENLKDLEEEIKEITEECDSLDIAVRDLKDENERFIGKLKQIRDWSR